jgi:hypothetical protein
VAKAAEPVTCVVWLGLLLQPRPKNFTHEEQHSAKTNNADEPQLDQRRSSHILTHEPPIKLMRMAVTLAYQIGSNALCQESRCDSDDKKCKERQYQRQPIHHKTQWELDCILVFMILDVVPGFIDVLRNLLVEVLEKFEKLSETTERCLD